MSNFFAGVSVSISSFLKRIRLEQILVVLLAGVLVLATTACNPDSPRSSGSGSYGERVGQPSGAREFSGRADAKNRPDLNTYNDYGKYGSGDDSGLPAKAKELVRNADRNANRQIQDPGDLIENIREGKPFDQRVKDLSDRVGNRAEQFGEDVSEGAQKNFRTLQENVDSTGRTVKRAADDVS
jgi:predicted small secreted protein